MKDLEFLPYRYIRARLNQRLRFIRLWLLIVMALAMVCWALYSESSNKAVSNQVLGLETSLSVVDADLQKLKALQAQEQKYLAYGELVKQLSGSGPRTGVLEEVVTRLPDEIFLTRWEVDAQARDSQAQGAASSAAAPNQNRPGQAEVRKEMVDRVRVEGLAANDLALARFLQGLADGGVLQKGELAFSKDAQFRERDVRVFAATFYVAPESEKVARGKLTGGQL
jgi:Tfp pilus assembly protein PilN